MPLEASSRSARQPGKEQPGDQLKQTQHPTDWMLEKEQAPAGQQVERERATGLTALDSPRGTPTSHMLTVVTKHVVLHRRRILQEPQRPADGLRSI
jgi:hypothetical protein